MHALTLAISQNKSAVLGLDAATRELNTPHLGYDDSAVWTLGALQTRYMSCSCPLPPGVRPMRNQPAWRAQRQVAHLDGLGPDARLPLAMVRPAASHSRGVAAMLLSTGRELP